MRAAERTWALVVGIDEYDDPKIPRLHGAGADAVAVVGWLRALGVPDGQMLVHAAPAAHSRPAVEALGLPVRGCTEPEIWASVYALQRKSGERLFVFLCGHGLYEPGSGRLFLTKEAGTFGAWTNLGIDAYSKLFRTMNFRRQFLVMDGCLNYPYSPTLRSTIVAAMHAGVVPAPPRPETTLVGCFAAAQGEKALEVNGRGLFLSQLLPVIDPEGPHALATYIDDTEGVRVVDLRLAVNDVVLPQVSLIAHRQGRRQTASCEVTGAGASWPAIPVYDIPAHSTARVRVVIDPGGAVSDVRQIRLESTDTVWRRFVPAPPATAVSVPIESVLPVGTPLLAHCVLRPAAPWTGTASQTVVVDRDLDLLFKLQPPPAAASSVGMETEVNTVDAGGSVIDGMTPEAYTAVDEALSGATAWINVARHETGPVLSAAPGHRVLLAEKTAEIADAISRGTSADVHAAVARRTAGDVPCGLMLVPPRGGAVRLAGALMDERVLTVEGQHFTLSEVATDPIVPAGPGVVAVRLTLPWGAWSSSVRVADGVTQRLRLPASVGVPPLRVGVLAGPDRPWREPGSVVLLARSKVTVEVFDGLRGPSLGVLADRGRGVQGRDAQLPAWSAIAIVGGRKPLAFPLHRHGGVAIARAGLVRAEPLSDIPRPEWDLLVSSGRLEALTADEAVGLTNDKWFDVVLGLAGAYACFAHGHRDYLEVVLENLRNLDDTLPDVAILAATLDRQAGRIDPATAHRLKAVGAARAVPVFRWGIPLAGLAARHYGLPEYADTLADVEARLYAGSVWTAWRP